MNTDSIYFRQVQLLVRVLPLIASESCFALKGGTAINLFVRDMPRLSVDIDLVYLPMEDRKEALANIGAALTRIGALIKKTIQGISVQNTYQQSEALRLIVSQQTVRIKIELSPVIRGTVFPEKLMAITPAVQNIFGYAEMSVVSIHDLYAGKIAAALDRQHPRDLFDIKLLFENEGFTDDLRKTYLVYLVSHQRPMSELLNPNRKDISNIYLQEFVNMSDTEVTLKELEETRERLISTVKDSLTSDEKKFLVSFKSKDPDWNLLGLNNIEVIQRLPSVRWKLNNLEQMTADKHSIALERLLKALDNGNEKLNS